MNDSFFLYYNSPIGILKISSDSNFLTSIEFIINISSEPENKNDLLKICENQLEQYFKGERKNFDLPLKPRGTEFQRRVWNLVYTVPFGETSNYLSVAKQLGSNKLTRAVGLANGANPIPIIIPCHRVIGSNGKLTGYAGGLDTKRWLLSHELQYSDKSKKHLLF